MLLQVLSQRRNLPATRQGNWPLHLYLLHGHAKNPSILQNQNSRLSPQILAIIANPISNTVTTQQIMQSCVLMVLALV